MVRHVVLFSFRDDVDDDRRAEVLAACARLPEQYPVLEGFQMGVNASERDDRFTHGFVTHAATMAGLQEYLNSDGHERFVATLFRPAVSERAIFTFEV